MNRKTAWQAWLKGLDAFLRIDPHYKFACGESEELGKPASGHEPMLPMRFTLDTRGLDPQLHADPELSRIIRSATSFSAQLASEAEVEVDAKHAEKAEWHRHRRWDDP